MTVIVLITAALIVLAAIAVGLGRGGEMAHFAAAATSFDPDVGTAADVALLRPPIALLGYDVQATSNALGKIAHTMSERDVEIEELRGRIAELQDQVAELAAEQARAAPRPAGFAAPPPPPAPPERPGAQAAPDSQAPLRPPVSRFRPAPPLPPRAPRLPQEGPRTQADSSRTEPLSQTEPGSSSPQSSPARARRGTWEAQSDAPWPAWKRSARRDRGRGPEPG